MTTWTNVVYALLHKVWAFSQVFIPTIAVYLAVVQVSLKIGAQHAPRLQVPATEPPASSGENQGAPKRRSALGKLRRIVTLRPSNWPPVYQSFLLSIVLALSWIFDYFSKADAVTKKWVFYGFLVLPGTFSVARLPLRTPPLFVARTQTGVPFYFQAKEKETWVTYLFWVFVGLGISTAALLDGAIIFVRRLCQAVLYGAFLLVLLMGSVTSNAKHRNLRPRVISATLGGVMSTAAIVGVMVYVEKKSGILSPNERLAAQANDNKSKADILQRYSMIFQIASWQWSSICFEIITLCYKMDYALALESLTAGKGS